MLQKKAPGIIKKLTALLDELKEHPYTGTGKIEK
jgi:Txe/YoeB family toxin of Txe-Axe toxin-antitoxin module